MTKSKHTPGPWVIRETDEYSEKLSIQTDEYYVALVDFSHDQTANARLIAAAPDMMEALESMLMARDTVEREEARREARAAIAKAKGGE